MSGVYDLAAKETTNRYPFPFNKFFKFTVKLEITTTMQTHNDSPSLLTHAQNSPYLTGYKPCLLYLGYEHFDVPESFREQMTSF